MKNDVYVNCHDNECLQNSDSSGSDWGSHELPPKIARTTDIKSNIFVRASPFSKPVSDAMAPTFYASLFGF
ncbi:hypothetical protein DWV07_01500 [Dickeya zeae]|nr:hypothetical protein DWV07_01500 [Dickeya zeae]